MNLFFGGWFHSFIYYYLHDLNPIHVFIFHPCFVFYFVFFPLNSRIPYFSFVLFLLLLFSVYRYCFAGTCTPAILTLRQSMGKSNYARFYQSRLNTASSSLCTAHVPMPVYWAAFEMQTARQVQIFTNQLLVFSRRILWLIESNEILWHFQTHT